MGVWSGMKQRMKYAEINVEDKLKTVRENCFDAMIIDPTNTGSWSAPVLLIVSIIISNTDLQLQIYALSIKDK